MIPTPRIIKNLCGVGVLIALWMTIYSVTISNWWDRARTHYEAQGQGGVVFDALQVGDLDTGKTLLDARPGFALSIFALVACAALITAFTLGVRAFIPGKNYGKLVAGISAIGLLVTLLATQIESPGRLFELTGTWAATVVGWLILLASVAGLVATHTPELESETRPDSSDG